MATVEASGPARGEEETHAARCTSRPPLPPSAQRLVLAAGSSPRLSEPLGRLKPRAGPRRRLPGWGTSTACGGQSSASANDRPEVSLWIFFTR